MFVNFEPRLLIVPAILSSKALYFCIILDRNPVLPVSSFFVMPPATPTEMNPPVLFAWASTVPAAVMSDPVRVLRLLGVVVLSTPSFSSMRSW
ncbi:MAG: hypothetical protein BWY66_00279 [bacterium ADurb.Bin374]|nr:MAG: hypothetical protein BWY66_00279 [bacterium ADurb.Bin374]